MSEHNNMHDLDETADRTVAAINKVDTKVTEMRQRRMADPDTLGDKALKMIIPSLAGLVGGKLFQMVWNSVMARVHPGPDDDVKDQQQGLMMSVLFAAASAAFGTLLTRLSDKGANSLVHHMQIKRDR
ncbi:membrane associated protein [Bifidobacterium pseudolongum subsp. globosum]|uniref:Membrane associated protein n=1 Tax=Bifidobacterium pseudolongum subsp. globosum TaxID=1690 RepID=A0A4Q5ADD6_9BIFI|nr:DUF4235 domain-containing protein [Bifidobacterium pseudolongum]RYQ23870.1 membrane associated protein [Bifidobacterium pseudolongum subsp. globosum]RYQ25304.1 membrane associated protein [Bifidobacterium pseudolongum subsp. globosum]